MEVKVVNSEEILVSFVHVMTLELAYQDLSNSVYRLECQEVMVVVTVHSI